MTARCPDCGRRDWSTLRIRGRMRLVCVRCLWSTWLDPETGAFDGQQHDLFTDPQDHDRQDDENRHA